MTASPRRHISSFSLIRSLGSRLSRCAASQAVLNCATAITVDKFLMDSRAASLLSHFVFGSPAFEKFLDCGDLLEQLLVLAFKLGFGFVPGKPVHSMVI